MKTRLKLLRTSDNSIQTLGTYSILDENGNVMFGLDCLELPWKDNHNKVSCIPAGKYPVQKLDKPDELSTSRLNYAHFWIKDVPDRGGIKIHIGNYFTNVEGCQLPGLGVGDINKDGQIDVTQSKAALQKMLDNLPENFYIEITYAPNVLTSSDTDQQEKTV